MGYLEPLGKKVRDVMTRGVVTVRFDAGLEEVLRAMKENDVTAVVAVDPSDEAMGVITTFDILRIFRDHAKEELMAMTAEDVMTPTVEHVMPTESLENAAKKMLEKKIHRLVIFSSETGRVPVGVLSSTDMMKILCENLRR
ncbi:MAG: CBS domain-containing protein [Candidatus Hydrothermarchaeota archaeon]